ncbi:hypothetical protein HAHE_21490 [Haloferula helveola]|uniref:Secreted protein n=1 Tax=Haloferula helveola TaxID=490095 RepID=A0ABN6H3L0_9BACT|nr:hypothetical protein HAHE_21490 [Haloferula helveola]
MKTYHLIPLLTAAALIGPAAHGIELVASSFGGCGTSVSASYATDGTSDPSASRPVGSPNSIVCSGPMVCNYRPVIAGTPKCHVLKGEAGFLNLVTVPDVPGWSWTASANLSVWSPVPGGDGNPVVVPIDADRRFFRLENPDLP